MRYETTKFSFQQVDVFSSKAFLGDALAVVIGADSLTTSEMATFARWTNLSETTFLLQPRTPDADYRVRIFTPVAELPFAGHPTLGSCHTWLSSGGRPKSGEIVQECEAGLIHSRRENERLSFVGPQLRRSGRVERDTLTRVIKGLRLTSDDIVDANWVDNGPGRLAVLLRSRADVLALRPDFSALSGLRVGVVAPCDTIEGGREVDFEVRAFTAAGFEDLVTGSLNAGIAQWLIATRIAPSSYIAAQGTALGRAGRVYVAGRRSDLDRGRCCDSYRWLRRLDRKSATQRGTLERFLVQITSRCSQPRRRNNDRAATVLVWRHNRR